MHRIFNAADSLPQSTTSPLRPLIMPEIFRLYYGCGLRQREALNLNVEDVDLQQGVLTIRNSKFQKDRLVHMAPETTKRLRLLQKKLCHQNGHMGSKGHHQPLGNPRANWATMFRLVSVVPAANFPPGVNQ